MALIRSALADPDLLVLDEATSAVDPQTELRATRALERLLDGRTSVTIAHRLSTAENADRVLVFDGGQLVEDGTHAAAGRRRRRLLPTARQLGGAGVVVLMSRSTGTLAP